MLLDQCISLSQALRTLTIYGNSFKTTFNWGSCNFYFAYYIFTNDFESDDEQKYVEQILEPQIPKMVESDGFVINKSALNQDIKNVDDEMKINKISDEKIKSLLSDSQKNKSTSTPLVNSEAIYKKFEKYKHELDFNSKHIALSAEEKK